MAETHPSPEEHEDRFFNPEELTLDNVWSLFKDAQELASYQDEQAWRRAVRISEDPPSELDHEEWRTMRKWLIRESDAVTSHPVYLRFREIRDLAKVGDMPGKIDRTARIYIRQLMDSGTIQEDEF